MEKLGGSAELHLRNATRDTLGVLTNIGNGRTRFIRARIVGDTLFVGRDTLIIATNPTIQEVINNGNLISDANDSIKVADGNTFTLHGGTGNTGATLNIKASSSTSFGHLSIVPDGFSLRQRNLSTGNYKGLSGSSLSNSGLLVFDQGDLSGLHYENNYRTNGIANFGDRWIPDWGAVKDSIAGAVDTLENTGVIPGHYTNANVTVLADGRIDSIANGPTAAANPARMGQVGKSKFVIFASCIVRLDTADLVSPSTYDIVYSLLNETDLHDQHFFYSAEPDINGHVQVNFPKVKYVHYGTMIPDDNFNAAGVSFGTGVDLDKMYSYMYSKRQSSYLIKLSDVTSTPAAMGAGTLMTIAKDAGGVFTVADPNYNTVTGGPLMIDEVASISLNLRIKNTPCHILMENDATTGLPNLKFTIRDAFGNLVNSFDSDNTGDYLEVTEPTQTKIPVDARYWREFQMNKKFLYSGAITNIWCFGIFEVWLMCSPVSATSILAEWQPYTGATDYQLYRSTSQDFSGETMVYTGTGLDYTDVGLTANTKYWYRLKGTVSGVPNTVITSFDSKTNPF